MKKSPKLQPKMPKNYLKSNTKLAIIGGSGVCDPEIFKKEIKIETPFGFSSGPIQIGKFSGKRLALLLRHGKRTEIPPHKINHKANLFALKKIGVKYIFAFNSVGSLKKEIKSGNFLIPSDFIDFDPPTFYNKNPEFTIPEISEKLRKVLIKILEKLKLKFWPEGIYFNTRGPRLETKAEINLIRRFADVVGMTMAREATLANELSIEYVSLCSVDNYAHGLTKKPLTLKEIEENQKKNKNNLEKIIREILKLKIG